MALRILVQIKTKLEKIVLFCLTMFGLSVTYVFGIGLMSIFGKTVGKRFLLTKQKYPVNFALYPNRKNY